MGVVKQRDNDSNRESVPIAVSNEAGEQLIESFAEKQANESDQLTKNSLTNSPSPSRKKAKKWFEQFRKWDNARNIKRSAGIRQNRRLENLNFLLTMNEKDETNDVEFVDIVEPQLSAFAGLFQEQEKMRIWNDFINRSEEDQNDWLSDHKPEPCQFLSPDFSDTEDDVDEQDSSWEQLDDRMIHPAFSAEQCFKRIDANLKSLLKKRHIPLGTISWLEKELMNFFTEWPNSVYVSKLPSSFDRMMLHAVCQYLDLQSRSFDDRLGNRQTEVENPREMFYPPDISLSQFIEAKIQKL